MTFNRKPAWKRSKSVSGAKLGAVANKVYICKGCEAKTFGKRKPKECDDCGFLDFHIFHSTGECGRWHQLKILQDAGHISNLDRQVRMPLYTAKRVDGTLLQVKVAVYVADFVYFEDGKKVIEDFKSAGLMDDVAKLKLRWMEAQGQPVKIVS